MTLTLPFGLVMQNTWFSNKLTSFGATSMTCWSNKDLISSLISLNLLEEVFRALIEYLQSFRTFCLFTKGIVSPFSISLTAKSASSSYSQKVIQILTFCIWLIKVWPLIPGELDGMEGEGRGDGLFGGCGVVTVCAGLGIWGAPVGSSPSISSVELTSGSSTSKLASLIVSSTPVRGLEGVFCAAPLATKKLSNFKF